MTYPEVKFCLNKNLDKRIAIEFLGFAAGGINFSRGILNIHPSIKKLIFDYIDSFYKENYATLKKYANDFEKKWKLIEKRFFKITAQIFKNHPWPKGRYIGYISIFNCNPRFLKDKTFQIFYKHKAGPVYITAHELLHFIFYDYIKRRRKDLKKRLNDDELWRLSEIINSILLSSRPLKTVLDVKKFIGYPDLEKSIKQIKKRIKRVDDIDNLIDLSIKFLN